MMTAAALSAASPRQRYRTASDWLAALGNVPLDRIIFDPWPGTVTLEEYERIDGRVAGRPVELVNATLVEKPMGSHESAIAMELSYNLKHFIKQNGIGGRVTGEAGPLRMSAANVRMPDVCWTAPGDRRSSERDKKVPQEPPTLAVEVISEDNTDAEMDQKLREYFASGCRLGWVLYPKTRTLRVFAGVDRFRTLEANDTLDGGDVLPGFSVRVGDLFDV